MATSVMICLMVNSGIFSDGGIDVADRLEITETILNVVKSESRITISDIYKRVDENLSTRKSNQFPSIGPVGKINYEDVLKYLVKKRILKLFIDEDELAIYVGIGTSRRVRGFSNSVSQLAAIGK
jgi:hypothetical protein